MPLQYICKICVYIYIYKLWRKKEKKEICYDVLLNMIYISERNVPTKWNFFDIRLDYSFISMVVITFTRCCPHFRHSPSLCTEHVFFRFIFISTRTWDNKLTFRVEGTKWNCSSPLYNCTYTSLSLLCFISSYLTMEQSHLPLNWRTPCTSESFHFVICC